jgi:multicomponent Na+:H+ antiporter subunit G
MVDLFAGIAISIGAVFIAAAAIGVVRMPDLYLRASATSKASTLGAVLLLLGAAVHFEDAAVVSRAVAAALGLMLTSPVAAHVVTRAAYRTGVPLWSGTVMDEMPDQVRGEDGQEAGPTAAPPSP